MENKMNSLDDFLDDLNKINISFLNFFTGFNNMKDYYFKLFIASYIIKINPKKEILILTKDTKLNSKEMIEQLFDSYKNYEKYERERNDTFNIDIKEQIEKDKKLKKFIEQRLENIFNSKNIIKISYDDFYNEIYKSKNMKKTINEKINNKIVITDIDLPNSEYEYNNLNIDLDILDNIIKDNNISKLKDIEKNKIYDYIKYLITKIANNTTKIIFILKPFKYIYYSNIELILYRLSHPNDYEFLNTLKDMKYKERFNILINILNEYFLFIRSDYKKEIFNNTNFLNRRTVYNTYKDIKPDSKGKLLKQQVFLSKYIQDNYAKITNMLLFHGIGTGKTCTSNTVK